MARPAYSLGIGVGGRAKTLNYCLLMGAALTAFITAITFIKQRIPQSGTIIGMTLNVGVKGGTFSVGTLTVANNGVTVAVFDVAAAVAGTPIDKEGANLAATNLVKDNLISVVSAESGGTSPTWSNVLLSIDYIPTGD